MLRNSLIPYDLVLECLEYVRDRRGRICCLIFFYLNWGNSYQALKSALTMGNFKLLQVFDHSIDITKDDNYWEVYSTDTAMVYADTIVSAASAFFAGFLYVQFVDRIGAPKALTNRDLRRLRNWTRRETKLLETKGRLILSLQHESDIKDAAFETIKALEKIIQRYEHNALALNPNAPKRPKLSKKDDTLGDLFDEQVKPRAAPRGLKKIIQFRRKF